MSNKPKIVEVNTDPLNSAGKIMIKLSERPRSVQLNGEEINYEWNRTNGTINLSFKKNVENKVEIKK